VRSVDGNQDGSNFILNAQDLPDECDIVIDCAGHEALRQHGPTVLGKGSDLITLSLGALADDTLAQKLEHAASARGTKLYLASGAIGALDCLQSASVGALQSVTYSGRKPPKGWMGSPAESSIDLQALTSGSAVHFEGTARQAALAYPKNANVAAAIALAGIGFDKTRVELIADADISENIHEVRAEGDFGSFQFRIAGNALPDNPKSSALAAMSVVSKIDQLNRAVTL
jgi:aspartate dehydrogenase